MSGLVALWGHFDLLQRKTWIRVFATIIVVAASAGFFGSVVQIRHGWETASRQIAESLTGDEATVYGSLLREHGTVVIADEEFAGPVEVLQTVIDEDGTPRDVQRIVVPCISVS